MSTAEELAEKGTDLLQNVVIARAEAANLEDFTVDVPKCSSWRVGGVLWDEEVEHHWLLVQRSYEGVSINTNCHVMKFILFTRLLKPSQGHGCLLLLEAGATIHPCLFVSTQLGASKVHGSHQ